MPKVTMFISPTLSNFRDFALKFPFSKAGQKIRELVAEAASTKSISLSTSDIDFIRTIYPPGTLVDYPISFELETIGYPDRKVKLNRQGALELKSKIVKVLMSYPAAPQEVDFAAALLWIKFVDPDGCHV